MEYIDKLKDKVEKDPNSTLFVPLAEEYRKAGRFDEAIGVLVSGIERQPAYSSAKVALGKIYLEKDMKAEARVMFEQVVSVNPDNFYAQKKLAELYKAMGDIPLAIERFKALLGMNPMDEAAQAELGALENMLSHPAQDVPEADRTQRVQPIEEVQAVEAVVEESHEQYVMPPQAEPEAAHEIDLESEMMNFSASLSDKEDFGEIQMEEFGELDPEQPEAIIAEQAEDGFGYTQMFSPMSDVQPEAEGEVTVEPQVAQDDLAQAMSFADIEAVAGEVASEPQEVSELEESELDETGRHEVVASYEPQGVDEPEGAEPAGPAGGIDNEMLFGEADFAVATENYARAMAIYNDIVAREPQNIMALQRASELQMLLKMLGRESDMMEAKLTAFADALKRRSDEFRRDA